MGETYGKGDSTDDYKLVDGINYGRLFILSMKG